MFFKQILVGGYDQNFSYLIGDDQTSEVALVDPDNVALLHEIVERESLKVVAILITHEHFDHIQGVPEAIKRWPVPVYAHAVAVKKMLQIKAKFKEIKDQDIIKIGHQKIQVIEAPGHADSCVCYLSGNKMIVGDVLFVGGCGRCDLPGSDVEKMWNTFNKLKKLPDETEIYPGHDYGSMPYSTLGEEKKFNRFLNCQAFEEFMQRRMR